MDMPAVAPDSPSEVAPPIRSQCALCPQVSNRDAWLTSNALVQLQAHYNHRGEAASEKCLSAATFVRQLGRRWLSSTLCKQTFCSGSAIDFAPCVGFSEVFAEATTRPECHIAAIRAEVSVAAQFARQLPD